MCGMRRKTTDWRNTPAPNTPGKTTSRKSTSSPPEIIALVTAGVVYWLTIYPRARLEIRRWRRRAQRIPDLTLRAQALYKLTFERLNPEAAAFFAVLAPWRHRRALVRLMVDFQIAYDYLDAINEEPETASLRNGLQLHRALGDAVSSRASDSDYYLHHPRSDDGGYLRDLVRACQRAVQSLPSALALEPLLVHAAERCGEAQSRNHAVLVEGSEQLIEWAAEQQDTGEYLWWELAAAGISCLALHALFAAAAGPTTLAEAERIDSAYYPPICAISALLDSLVDLGDDAGGTNHSFVGHYPTSNLTSERFAAITREARLLSSVLRHHRRHAVILAGIASFYLSAPGARTEHARPAARRTLACLGPSSVPILAVMRLRRRSAG
jgi:tetraprenyl-beta-curcumene synthase